MESGHRLELLRESDGDMVCFQSVTNAAAGDELTAKTGDTQLQIENSNIIPSSPRKLESV